ncbi:YgaP family membrane protein [Brevibacillus migulae]|uniref:YgaP family membrane protein n=1 Tax=Brevibacillus migulae TaxID=1644114 RepID=UPI00106E200E|nr:DUF2892 domain-containing protein [Brevibacillus migulae]
MRKNVGTIDATIRITMGLLGLAYGIGKMSRRTGRTPWVLMTLSAMKVAEGITRYCPMLDAIGTNTRGNLQGTDEKEGTKATSSFTDTMIAKAVQNMVGTETRTSQAKQGLSQQDQQIENDLKDYLAGQGTTTPAYHEHQHRPSDAYRADERIYPNYT